MRRNSKMAADGSSQESAPHGYAEDDVEKVMYGSWERFLRQAWG